jgi:two-component system cell cycle response regulator CpdR
VDRSKSPLTEPTVTPAPLRILYVEDDALVREITSELLAQAQRQIVAVSTAEEALREFETRPFDVVITDVSLPAMSGLHLAKRLREMEPKVPIIVASGYALELSPQTWGPGVRAIVKPFEPAAMDSLIAELCAER